MGHKPLSEAEILAQMDRARERGEAEAETGLRARAVRYDRRHRVLLLQLTNGYLFGVPVAELPAIADATVAQLAAVELSPEGGAIRFESLDADYSVPGLILRLGARVSGAKGGRARSKVKREAARANGAKGGRPTKFGRVRPTGKVGKSGKVGRFGTVTKIGRKLGAKKPGTTRPEPAT